MSSSWLDVVVPLLLLSCLLVLSPIPSLLHSRFGKITTDNDNERIHHPGYIVPVLIHHARILPKASRHKFKYPSIFLAVDLKSMESGRLESNRVFSWTPLITTTAGAAPTASITATITTRKGQEQQLNQKQQRQRQKWCLTKLNPDGFGRRSFIGLDESVQLRLSKSMLLKLMYELRLRGYISVGPQDDVAVPQMGDDSAVDVDPWSREVGRVWAVAMPSLLGMGGFNPLTIYYVYRPKEGETASSAGSSSTRAVGKLWLVVLEVHNTFNERHVYICRVGVAEDTDKDVIQRRGYQHSWTFPRAFHVSPFNDRSGYYQLLMSDLWTDGEDWSSSMPTVDVRLLLLVEDEKDEEDEEDYDFTSTPPMGPPKLHKKLLATLTSNHAKSSSLRPYRDVAPLTSANMIKAVVSQPFDLILPVSRIMWQAAKLHWKHKLPVFIRPEQCGQDLNTSGVEEHTSSRKGAVLSSFDGVGWPVNLNPVQHKREKSSFSSSGAIYWNQDGFIEKACQSQFESLLCQRTAKHRDILVSIQSRNTEVPSAFFFNGSKVQKVPMVNTRCLTIYTLASTIYSDFSMYTPLQAHLFGSRVERSWGVSSMQDFMELFDCQTGASPKSLSSFNIRWAAWARQTHLKWAISTSESYSKDDKQCQDIAKQLLNNVANHPYNTMNNSTSFLLALLIQLLLIRITAAVSSLLRIRYVRRPWAQVDEGFQLLRAESQKFHDT